MPANPDTPARASPARSSRSRSCLLLRRRVTTGRLGQLVDAREARTASGTASWCGRDRAELRAARLLDQPALQQRGRGRVGADAADAGDLRSRHRLQVGDDRQRLGLGRRSAAACRGLPSRRRAAGSGVRVAGQGVAAGQLAQQEAAPLGRIVLAASASSAVTTSCSLGVRGLGQRRHRHRVRAEEQQRLERSLRARRSRAAPCRAGAGTLDGHAVKPQLARSQRLNGDLTERLVAGPTRPRPACRARAAPRG